MVYVQRIHVLKLYFHIYTDSLLFWLDKYIYTKLISIYPMNKNTKRDYHRNQKSATNRWVYIYNLLT